MCKNYHCRVFIARSPNCGCDLSPREKGNTRLTKLFGGLSKEKIRRYNNSPSIGDGKMAATADSFLNYSVGGKTL